MLLSRGVGRILDRRLCRDDPAPILVGLSGGGDSLALLLAARAWAAGAGRTLMAATVDHGLRPEGAAWARACQARCADLAIEHISLRWEGPRPAVGIPAAARAARHGLLAAAARGLGARVVLLGHTADDVLEAAWMRAGGATTPAPREWAPSPVWPQGRGVFLLRPMLFARRREVREQLRALGETWIEDPANEDPASVRALARAALVDGGDGDAPAPACLPGAPPFVEGPGGELLGDRETFARAPPGRALSWVGAAMVCASGASRLPRRRSLEALLAKLAVSGPVSATLAGARLICHGEHLMICREASQRRGSALESLSLPLGEAIVWEGRFELVARRPGLTVEPLRGHAGALSPALRRSVRLVAREARGALPLVKGPGRPLACPSLSPGPAVEARSLIMARLSAACGGVDHERAIVPWRSEVARPKSAPMSGKRPADEFA